MAWPEVDVGNGRARDGLSETECIKGMRSLSDPADCPTQSSSLGNKFEGKDALSYANILRSRNKYGDALILYNIVLEKESGNLEALVGRGICLQAQNLNRQAFESFMEVIKLDPQHACALTHCGVLYKDEGRLLEAAESYQKALKVDPSYRPAAECLAVVLTDIGTSLKLAGNTEAGIQKYCEALNADSRYAPAYYNLGVVYSEMLQFELALSCYEKAALQRPMYAEAYCNMGVIYKNRGDLETAITCYERCLAVSPNFEIAKNNMAIALTDLGTKVKLEGDITQGVELYKKALCYNWRYADAMYNLGVAYGEMLKFDMAIVFYELALHFNPHCAEACNNLGVIYKDRDNLDKAVECYQMALSIKPNFSQSLNNLGVVYTVQGKIDAAAGMIEKAIAANPTYAEAYNNLGVLYRDAGNINLAIEAYERCLEIDPDSRNAGQNRLLAMNYINEGSDEKLFEAHREWGRRFMRLYQQYTSWDNPKVMDRPLIIGYVSPDYFTHSVSYFIEAPLSYHDYTEYQVVVYSAVVKADAKTFKFKEKVLKKGGLWRDIYGIDEKKVAQMVREDKVDILVELTGHTANNKLGALACRPAPVQVTWIGYPNTSGLPSIDYRISDSFADPPTTRQKQIEELVRLSECFLCYTPSPEAGVVSPAPALSNGFVTFGSFNNLAKITPKVLKVWAKILCAVPNSRLIVKCKPFCCDSIRQRFLSILEQLGVEHFSRQTEAEIIHFACFRHLGFHFVFSAANMSRHPEIKWAQRPDKIYLTILLSDAKNVKINLEPDGLFTFSGTAGSENILYDVKLELFDKVNVEASKLNAGVRSIFCVIEKEEKGWWKKLLRGDGKLPHYIKVDWDKWAEEDEDDAGPVDDFGGMDFSKFGNMGGMGGMGGMDGDDDLDASDDEEADTAKTEDVEEKEDETLATKEETKA